MAPVVLPPTGSAAHPRSNAPLATTSNPELLTAFPAASFNSDVAAFGSDQAVWPPDTQLAVGPSDLVAPVNNAVWVWSKTGTALATADLRTFFAIPSGYFFSDPRVAYDVATSRWLLSGVAFDSSNDSIVYLAISQTSDPTGLYYTYAVNSKAGVLQDQPKFGFDSNVVVLSWNDFSGSPLTFSGQETWVLQKSELLAGAAVSQSSFLPDTTRFDIVPVQSLASTSTEYLVYNDSCGANSTGSCTTGTSALGLVAITGTPAAGDVTWSETDLAMAPTTSPPAADQPGAAASLSTNDDEFLTATSAGGMLYVSGNDGCVPSGDSVRRPCARLIEVSIGASPVVTFDGDLGYSGGDLYYPAVVPDANGNAFIASTFSSTSIYPEATALLLAAGASSFSGVAVEAGSGAYGFSGCSSAGSTGCRWGDYSGAAVDPSNPTDIWVAAEYAPTSGDDWGTAIGELTVAPPSVTGLSPSTGPTAGGTIVTITGSGFAGATSVQFGGNAASNLVVIDAGTIQATSPAGGAGTVDITVITPSGTTPATSADHFTYVVPSAGSYQAGQPTRICDTRPIQPGVVANQCNNSSPRSPAPIGPGGPLTIDVCAGAGSGCSLSAVAINVAVTGATDSSFLTVYPTGVAQPNASNLNYTPGDTVANLVEVKVGTNGTITLYNHAGSVDVVVDLEGTVAGGSTSSGSPGLYTPVPPQRICDTRVDQVGVVTNQCNNGGAGATLGSNGTLNVQITGQGGIPSTGVSAVVLNVAVTDTSTSGYLTAWPTDNPRPSASNVNWAAAQTVPNRVIVPVGHNGQISIYNFSGAADVVIDVNGWYGDGTEPPPPGATFTGITPTRICDTRADQPGVATNQCNNGGAGLPLGSGVPMTVQVTSNGGAVPVGARGVVVNVAVTDTTASSFLTVWPSDVSQPTISDLNWAAGETVPNLVVVKLSASGQISVFNHSGSADVIVDVVGYYT